jgi:hypothetical protein
LRISFGVIMLLAWLIFRVPSPAASDSMNQDLAMPFQPGEKLVYELKWTIIPAGFGTLEVLPMDSISKQEAYHFRLHVRTNEVVDTFYKVRDEINGYTNKAVSQSIFYHKIQQEGRHERDEKISFDWSDGVARYTNFGKPKPPVNIPPGTFDPMSVLYFVRLQALNTGTILQRPVTDGKKCIIGIAKVVGREIIEVPAGTFDTWRVEPELEHIGGVFRKSPNARIQLWITTDRHKRIVRLKSKVVVGSFVADLISIDSPPNQPADIASKP